MRCIHCGYSYVNYSDVNYSDRNIPEGVCKACGWMYIGISEGTERKAVARADIILDMFEQHYSVKNIQQIHQLMVDLTYGSEDDEDIMQCVGFLRQILEKAYDEELETLAKVG